MPAWFSSFYWTARKIDTAPSRYILWVGASVQRMQVWEAAEPRIVPWRFPRYIHRSSHVVSTSKFGYGQVNGSNQTPLGLHRVARKVGAGHPIGTVFRGRQAVGRTWQGMPTASITHRILWLEGLESGFNRGGNVDTFSRYIYIHGFGDELTLGRPASHGCIHVRANELIPLFDLVPKGTLVWITLT